MTPDAFLSNFDLLAEAPGGVPKLRELVLQLAVRGQLVPQDPQDEPATVLVEKIAAQRERLGAVGGIGKEKPLPPVKPSDVQYSMPEGWASVRLGCLMLRIGSGSTPRGGKNAYVERGVPFVRSQNVWDSGLRLDDVAHITEETHKKMRHTHVCPNDLLLNITGASLGRCAVVPPELRSANVSQHVSILRPVMPDMTPYLHLSILSPMIQHLIWTRQVGMAREGLSKKVLELFEFPLPPLSEQKRIVVRVDELMKRCDELEARQKERNARHTALVSSCLHAVVDPKKPNPDFILHPLSCNLLFTSQESVTELRKTIFQLAVQGRLVKQDPKDEPASRLVERIALTVDQPSGGKTKLAENTKPHKILHAVTVPPGWQQIAIGDLRPEFQNGFSKRASQTGMPTPVLRLANIINGAVSLEDVRVIPLSPEEREKYAVLPSDILITRVNGSVDLVGAFTHVCKSADAAYCDHFIRMRFPHAFVRPDYVALFGRSIVCRKAIAGLFITTAGQKTVNQGHISSLTLSLPPLAEQKRIVAKVNELMALCDALEAKLTQSHADADTLAAAVVHCLTGGCNAV